jgi:hypothetical protein
LEILGDASTKTFRNRASVLAAFLCILAAMRLHLRLMPSIMAKRVGARDTEAAEDALIEWSCAFAAHWFGEGFEKEPILPTNIEKLSDFYRPLEGKNSPPPLPMAAVEASRKCSENCAFSLRVNPAARMLRVSSKMPVETSDSAARQIRKGFRISFRLREIWC